MLRQDGRVVGCAVVAGLPASYPQRPGDHVLRAVYRHPDDGRPAGTDEIVPSGGVGAARIVADWWSRGTRLPSSAVTWLDVLETFDAFAEGMELPEDPGTFEWPTLAASDLSVDLANHSRPVAPRMRHPIGLASMTRASFRDVYAEAATAIRAFTSTLDPGALALMRARMRPASCTLLDKNTLRTRVLDAKAEDGSLAHAWRSIDASFRPEATLRHAMEACPAYVVTLLRTWARAPEAVTRAVRDGTVRNLVEGEVLSGNLPLASLPMLREAADALPHTSAGRWPTLAVMAAEERDDPVHLAVHLLRRFPASWRPRGPEGWVALANLAPLPPALDDLVRGTPLRDRPWPRDEALTLAAMPSLLPCRGRFEVLVQRLERASGRPVAMLRDTLRDVSDLTDAFAREVLIPCLIREGVRADGDVRTPDFAIAEDLIRRGRSLARTLEVSRDRHARRVAIEGRVRAVSGVPEDTSWPAAYPDAVDLGGVDVVVLTTEGQLRAEGGRGHDAEGGTGLDHCVGGYGPHCLSGRMRILSLRQAGRGTAGRTSTAAVGLDPAGRTRVLQHRGHANAGPPAADVAALVRYVGSVNEGTLPFDGAGLAPSPSVLSARRPYDWEVPGACEAVIAAWRPVLPKGLRGMTPAGLAAHVRKVDGVGHVGPWGTHAHVIG